MLRHLIIGPGPCIFEILEFRLFLEFVCVWKQEIGLVLVHEALDEIYKMPLHNFCPEAILGAASPYYWARPMYFRNTRV